jgi:hypothetical protein
MKTNETVNERSFEAFSSRRRPSDLFVEVSRISLMSTVRKTDMRTVGLLRRNPIQLIESQRDNNLYFLLCQYYEHTTNWLKKSGTTKVQLRAERAGGANSAEGKKRRIPKKSKMLCKTPKTDLMRGSVKLCSIALPTAPISSKRAATAIASNAPSPAKQNDTELRGNRIQAMETVEK